MTVLSIFQRTPTKAFSAEKVHGKIPGAGFIGQSAINNRLERLRELGFLSRHREGKTWMYSVRLANKKGARRG